MTENVKVERCLKCNNKTDLGNEEEVFCRYCGAPVVNRCSDYAQCNRTLPQDASFCIYCGAKSEFLLAGITASSGNTDDENGETSIQSDMQTLYDFMKK